MRYAGTEMIEVRITRVVLIVVLATLSACGKKDERNDPAAAQNPVLATNPLPPAATMATTVASNLPPLTNPASELPEPLPGSELLDEAVAMIRQAQDSAAATKGVEKLREAAELGNPTAQHAIGVCYFTGLGVTKSTDQALSWFHKSAEKGNADAQFKLASLYIRGDGVSIDEARAVELLKKAAEQGHAEAQYNLATLYSSGKSVPKDPGAAAAWFRRSADAGHAIAQSNMGVLHASGEVVEKSMDQALAWWRKAAEQGQPSAQFNLAQALFEGKAVPKDLVESYKWYHLAAEQGDRDAARMREALGSELAPAELGDALKRAREFKAQLHARWEARKAAPF